MKRIFLSSLVFVGFTSSAFAAPAVSSSKALSSALEVLNLPMENRKMLVQQKGETLYPGFMQVAFSDKYPMALRWKALVSGAQSKGKGSTADLLKAGKSKEWYMRNAALVALSEVNPAQGERLALELVQDKALVVRSAAVDVLQKNVTADVRDLLWRELEKSYNYKSKQSLWIRSQIVGALATKPQNGEAKTFAKLLSDSDQRVHLPAVRGLERLTGVKLGDEKTKLNDLAGMWKEYVQKENLGL